MRAAEAARNRDGFKDPTGATAAQRQKLAAALETTDTVLNGVTQEVKADVRQLEKERAKMLVPQVSALVGCQVCAPCVLRRLFRLGDCRRLSCRSGPRLRVDPGFVRRGTCASFDDPVSRAGAAPTLVP